MRYEHVYKKYRSTNSFEQAKLLDILGMSVKIKIIDKVHITEDVCTNK